VDTSTQPFRRAETFVNETFEGPCPLTGARPGAAGRETAPEWRRVHRWEGAAGVAACGAFGGILGGPGLFGFGTKVPLSAPAPGAADAGTRD